MYQKTSDQFLRDLQQSIEPLRQQIIHHPVYTHLKGMADLHVFMQHHVFAVWDFMSLLKTLQNNLTCTGVPWFPKGDADTRYLINEIVAGEESDVDAAGVRKSHFELYLEAMRQCGADTVAIETFTGTLKAFADFGAAYAASAIPPAAQAFVDYTFSVINGGKPHVQAAVFTFGREDLIPGMFHSLVADVHRQFPEKVAGFQYYLERHIEVDGDHHSQLALQMTANLCGNNETYWKEAEEATIDALQRRKELWDGVLAALQVPAV